jgi:putative peptidoglycan lipid II flippase
LGIYGLTYGTVLGALLFLGIQIPGLIRYRFRWTPAINLNHPGVRKVLRLLAPRIGSLFFIYLVLIYIPDNIASRLPEGSITALVYGWLIMQVPETLIGTAIGTALLPSISEQFVRNQGQVFAGTVNRALRVILAFTLPISVLVAVCIEPLVSLFGFDEAGTSLVVWTARAFLVGLAGHSILEVAARGFYAQQDALIPLWSSALMAVCFTILAVILAPLLGSPGIALANSLAFTGQALTLLYMLNRRIPGVLGISTSFLRAGLAALIGGGAVFLVLQLPFAPLPLSLAALLVGGLLALPFVWRDVKLLIQL